MADNSRLFDKPHAGALKHRIDCGNYKEEWGVSSENEEFKKDSSFNGRIVPLSNKFSGDIETGDMATHIILARKQIGDVLIKSPWLLRNGQLYNVKGWREFLKNDNYIIIEVVARGSIL